MTYHSQVYTLVVLEGVEQSHQPLALGVCEDVTLCKDVSDLVELEQQLLAHDLQRADFPSILLLRQENLPVPTLSDLGENLEITLAQTNTTLPEIGTLSTSIFRPDWVVVFFGSGRWFWELGTELVESILSSTNVAEEVEVVVEEVCRQLETGS